MFQRTQDFLTALPRAHSAAEVFGALRVLTSSWGFEEVILGRDRLDPATGLAVPSELEATDPEGVRRYLALASHDPMARFYGRLRQPKIVHVERFGRMVRTPEQERLWSDPHVRRSSLRVLMPSVAAPGGGSWTVLLGGTDNLRHRRDAEAALSALWLAAGLAGHRMLDIEQSSVPEDCPLSPRERECLLRLAAGERVDRIAERLSLANATVEMHLRNARHKIGARTSPEAVAEAVLRRWILP